MPDKKTDRRVERSRELLLDALVSLLMERGYERLTIQNLLDRAGVGRATFYAHFQSKEDLLSNSVARLRGFLTVQRDCAAPSTGGEAGQLRFALPFFQHLESHRRIYHSTIGRDSEFTVEQHMQRMLRDLVREDIEISHKGKANAATVDLAVRYAVGTLWAIVIWWMESQDPLPALEIDSVFRRTASPGLEAIFQSVSSPRQRATSSRS
jgi:AcrR family transcriptional regulator